MSKALVFSLVMAAVVGIGLGVGFKYMSDPSEGAKASPVTAIATEIPSAPTVTPASTTVSPTNEAKATKAQLLFFMNPNGRPCQMQDQALTEIRAEIEKHAEIVYFKTTNPADENQFYRYGIRSLPSLVILNAKGEEFKRFSPGIQDPKEVLAKLQELK